MSDKKFFIDIFRKRQNIKASMMVRNIDRYLKCRNELMCNLMFIFYGK